MDSRVKRLGLDRASYGTDTLGVLRRSSTTIKYSVYAEIFGN